MWPGFVWVRTGHALGHCQRSNETSDSTGQLTDNLGFQWKLSFVIQLTKQTDKQSKSKPGFHFSGVLCSVCCNFLPMFRGACRSHIDGLSYPRKHLAKLHIHVYCTVPLCAYWWNEV
jgi:hypothetical protein